MMLQVTHDRMGLRGFFDVSRRTGNGHNKSQCYGMSVFAGYESDVRLYADLKVDKGSTVGRTGSAMLAAKDNKCRVFLRLK